MPGLSFPCSLMNLRRGLKSGGPKVKPAPAYLYRYTMRPRVRSYGESSTATLSPAKMRIKFLRIFPEMCASTWCLFSSSTRNMALGNGSMTVAITSMASSLELPESPFFFSSLNCFAIVSCAVQARNSSPRRAGYFLWPRQNPGAVGGYRHGVLEMRRGAAIRCFRHPLIAHAHFRASRIHHRLHGYDHAFLQPRAASRITVIRQVGLVMHLGADAMPDKFPHHRKSVLFHPALHRIAYIAEPVACAHLFNRAIQRFAGHVQQLLRLWPNLSDRHRHRRIREIPVHFHPEIYRDDVAFAQLAFRRWNPVNNFAVHRSAQRARIPTVPFECRLARLSGNFLLGQSLEVHRRQPRAHRIAQRRQYVVHNEPGTVHLF